MGKCIGFKIFQRYVTLDFLLTFNRYKSRVVPPIFLEICPFEKMISGFGGVTNNISAVTKQ